MDTGFVTQGHAYDNVNVATAHPMLSFMWLPVMVLGFLGYAIVALDLVLEKGDAVDRSDRVAQLYGYSVCLVAIVVALSSIGSLIDNAFRYANPLQSPSYQFGASWNLSSFEAFKATYDIPLPGEQMQRPKLSDAELRQRYEVLRNEHINSTRYSALQSMTTSGTLLVIAVILFAFHWRWLKNRAKAASASTT